MAVLLSPWSTQSPSPGPSRCLPGNGKSLDSHSRSRDGTRPPRLQVLPNEVPATRELAGEGVQPSQELRGTVGVGQAPNEVELFRGLPQNRAVDVTLVDEPAVIHGFPPSRPIRKGVAAFRLRLRQLGSLSIPGGVRGARTLPPFRGEGHRAW